jgi:hypothetical protein
VSYGGTNCLSCSGGKNLIVSGSFYFISSKINVSIPIVKHKGEKYFVSFFPNFVSFIFLKNPTYLKSPIALNVKILAIIQSP